MLSTITVIVGDSSNQAPSLPDILLPFVVLVFLVAVVIIDLLPLPKGKSPAYTAARENGATRRQAKRVEKWRESEGWMQDIAITLAGGTGFEGRDLSSLKSKEDLEAAAAAGRAWMESYRYNGRTGKRLKRGQSNHVPTYQVTMQGERSYTISTQYHNVPV